jgi:hypothetical protein
MMGAMTSSNIAVNGAAVLSDCVFFAEVANNRRWRDKRRTMRHAKHNTRRFNRNIEGDAIKKQDGEPVVRAEDPAVASDVAERLNEDEDRREEDKWSA